MNIQRIDFSLPSCQRFSREQSKFSLTSRIVCAALAVIALLAGILAFRGILDLHTLSASATGAIFIACGSLFAAASLFFRCVKKEKEQNATETEKTTKNSAKSAAKSKKSTENSAKVKPASKSTEMAKIDWERIHAKNLSKYFDITRSCDLKNAKEGDFFMMQSTDGKKLNCSVVIMDKGKLSSLSFPAVELDNEYFQYEKSNDCVVNFTSLKKYLDSLFKDEKAQSLAFFSLRTLTGTEIRFYKNAEKPNSFEDNLNSIFRDFSFF